MLKLYHLDRSPFGWKVRLVLAEKNVPYESIIPVNKNEDPDFAQLNPYRLTPVLQLEDGRTIYESSVINEYLDEVFRNPPMFPEDPYERARIRILEDTTDQYLYATIKEFRAAQYDYAPPWLVPKRPDRIDHGLLETSRTKLHAQLAGLESVLDGKTWFGGEMFSIADAALAPPLTGSLEVMGVLPDPKRYANLAAWRGRLVERPSYIASKPKEPLRIKR